MTDSALITIIVVTALLILGNFAFWAFVHRNRVDRAYQDGLATGRESSKWHEHVVGQMRPGGVLEGFGDRNAKT